MRRRRKKHANRNHKANPRNANRPFRLNRRYQKMCSKGINFPPRTKYREQTYRRFNFTKQRSAFRETPYPPSGGQNPTKPSKPTRASNARPYIVGVRYYTKCGKPSCFCVGASIARPCDLCGFGNSRRELHQRSCAAPLYIGLCSTVSQTNYYLPCRMVYVCVARKIVLSGAKT